MYKFASIMAVLFNILLIFVNVLLVYGQINVKDETNINCVKLSECTKLYNVVNKEPFKDNYNSLLNICGLDGVEIKVWCPIIHEVCKTPDGKQSTCRTIVECPQFYNATKYLSQDEFINLLPKYACVSDDGIFRVCCPDYKLTKGEKTVDDNLITEISPLDKRIQTERSKLVESTTQKVINIYKVNLLPDPYKSECGKQLDEDRISGGYAADITDFPWMALLIYERRGNLNAVCGGTLINDRYVLTAAHCLERRVKQTLHVLLGEYDRKTNPDCVQTLDGQSCAPSSQLIRVEERIMHPAWVKSEPQIYNDIALLRMAERPKFNDYVKPICLPRDDIDLQNAKFTISGWGKTENGEFSDVKKRGDVVMKDENMCRDVFQHSIEGQLCVGHNNTQTDTCTGDSGGPLMYIQSLNKKIVWFQAGITSLGYNAPCGRYPALYTYIPRYLKWIYDTIRP